MSHGPQLRSRPARIALTDQRRRPAAVLAARAHVSKATLYRQRTGKATLVAYALKRIRQPIAQTAETGSLRSDFAATMRASTTAAPTRTPG
jgi:hypothetical protein